MLLNLFKDEYKKPSTTCAGREQDVVATARRAREEARRGAKNAHTRDGPHVEACDCVRGGTRRFAQSDRRVEREQRRALAQIQRLLDRGAATRQTRRTSKSSGRSEKVKCEEKSRDMLIFYILFNFCMSLIIRKIEELTVQNRQEVENLNLRLQVR